MRLWARVRQWWGSWRPDYDRAFRFTLRWEGGYVNDPDDPGGETKYGISKKSYPYLDIRALTQAQARLIYYSDYWLQAHCDQMSWPTNCILFDAAVNVGVQRALRWYYTIGDDAEALLARRERYYENLIRQKPRFAKYRKGWHNRVRSLRQFVGVG